jgi:hypothetical protein
MASERYSEPQPIPDDYEPPRRVSHDEYVRLEAVLPGKYEYHQGLIEHLHDGVTLDPDPTAEHDQ